jgi:hypothetical protein
MQLLLELTRQELDGFIVERSDWPRLAGRRTAALSGLSWSVLEARRLQRSFGDGLIAEEIEDLQGDLDAPRRCGAALVDPQARAQLELRGSGA